MEKTTTIVIVEDHQLVREIWVQLFMGKKDIGIVGDSGDFDEAIEMIKSKRPDIVLLDINLQTSSSGIDAVPLIRKFSPNSRIIAVSMHNQPVYAKKMLQLGAHGYVTKNSPHKEIFDAIEAVLNGKTYVCMEIRNILSDRALQDDTSAPRIKELSLREIEIIKLIKEGQTSKEIAVALNISIRTAEVHRHNILKKLALKNTPALINYINKTDLSV